MVNVGDAAPDFVLPMAGGDSYNDVEEFRLSEALQSGPVVLAFFPAVFTSGCTDEMCAFRDSLGAFEALDAQVYGVSADLSFSQNIFIQQEDLNFPLLADQDREVIRAYGVLLEDMYGYFEVPERSVFVVDTDGTVAWKWVREEDNPDDFGAFVDEVAEAVEAL
jgi:peroxiredoxin